ncbi:type II toxin-antitoxin system PemK/MazF family toxin [Methanoregula sp.]|uniref:type II toxin-antitoxin system PemK/MazF family toxin n=1 Tax=Methanoregula sp. TaxID=2052170 RepID=UPI003FD8A471
MKNGDIWLVDLSDAKGHEQRGERPAAIVGVQTVLSLSSRSQVTSAAPGSLIRTCSPRICITASIPRASPSSSRSLLSTGSGSGIGSARWANSTGSRLWP